MSTTHGESSIIFLVGSADASGRDSTSPCERVALLGATSAESARSSIDLGGLVPLLPQRRSHSASPLPPQRVVEGDLPCPSSTLTPSRPASAPASAVGGSSLALPEVLPLSDPPDRVQLIPGPPVISTLASAKAALRAGVGAEAGEGNRGAAGRRLIIHPGSGLSARRRNRVVSRLPTDVDLSVVGDACELAAGGDVESGCSDSPGQVLHNRARSEAGGLAGPVEYSKKRFVCGSSAPTVLVKRGSAALSRSRSGSFSGITVKYLGRSLSSVNIRRGSDLNPSECAGFGATSETAFMNNKPESRCPRQASFLQEAMGSKMQAVGMHFNGEGRGDNNQIDTLEGVKGTRQELKMGQPGCMQPESRTIRKLTENTLPPQKERNEKKTMEGHVPLDTDVSNSTAEGTRRAMSDWNDAAGRDHSTSSARTSKSLIGMLSRFLCCRSAGVATSNRFRGPHSVGDIKGGIADNCEIKGTNTERSKREKSVGTRDTKEQPMVIGLMESSTKPNEKKGHCVAKSFKKIIPKKAGESCSLEIVGKEALRRSCSLSFKIHSSSGDDNTCNEFDSAPGFNTPKEHTEKLQHQLAHFTSSRTSQMSLLIGNKNRIVSTNRELKSVESGINAEENGSRVPLESDLGALPLIARLSSESQDSLLQDVDKRKEIDAVPGKIQKSHMAPPNLVNRFSIDRENLHANDRSSSSSFLGNLEGNTEEAVKIRSSESLLFSEREKSSTSQKRVQIDDTFNNNMYVNKSVIDRTDQPLLDLVPITNKGEQCNGEEESLAQLKSQTHAISSRPSSTDPMYRPHTQGKEMQEKSKGREGNRAISIRDGEEKGVSPCCDPSTQPMLLSSSGTTATGRSPQAHLNKIRYAQPRRQIIKKNRVDSFKKSLLYCRNLHNTLGTNSRANSFSSHANTIQNKLLSDGSMCDNREHGKRLKNRAQFDTTTSERWYSRSRYLCPKEKRLLQEVYELDRKLHELRTTASNTNLNRTVATAALVSDSSPVPSSNLSQEGANVRSKAKRNEIMLNTTSTKQYQMRSEDGSDEKSQEDHKDIDRAQHFHCITTDSSIITQRGSFKDTRNSSYAQRFVNNSRAGQYIMRKHFPVKQTVGGLPKFPYQGDSSNEVRKAQRLSQNGSTRNEIPDLSRDNERIPNHMEKRPASSSCRRSTVTIHPRTVNREKIDETLMLYESLVQFSMLDDFGVANKVPPETLHNPVSDAPTRTSSQSCGAFTGTESFQLSDKQRNTSREDIFAMHFPKNAKIRDSMISGLSNESYIDCLGAALRHEYYGVQSATFGVPDCVRTPNNPPCEDKSFLYRNDSGDGVCGYASTTRRSGSALSEKGWVGSSSLLLSDSNFVTVAEHPPWRSSCAACSPQTAEAYAYWGLLSLFEQLQRPGRGGAQRLSRPVPARLYAPPSRLRRGAGQNKGMGDKKEKDNQREAKRKIRVTVPDPSSRALRRPFTPSLSAVRLYLCAFQRGRRAWRPHRWRGDRRERTTHKAGAWGDRGVGNDEQPPQILSPGRMLDLDARTVGVVGKTDEKYPTPYSQKSSEARDSGSTCRKENDTQVSLILCKSQNFQTPPEKVASVDSDTTSSEEGGYRS